MVSLTRIEIEGYKSIHKLALDLKALTVLIGANGAGKSNFIGVFKLLNQIAENRLHEHVVREGGPDRLLHFGRKVTPEININLKFGQDTYEVNLTVTDNSLLISQEKIGLTGLDFYHIGDNYPEEMRTQFGVIRSKDFRTLKMLQFWQIYHFHDTSDSAKMKQFGDLHDNAVLRPDASNLAAYLYLLREKHPTNYTQIVQTVRQVAPFFADFVLRPNPLNEQTIQLRWRETGMDDEWNAYVFSDGTLRFICLATLLLQPTLPSIILIDEPELGLHPHAISLLAGMLQSAAAQTQVIVCTQSATLVNQLAPEDLIVVERRGGESHFEPLSGEHIGEWLNDYALGELWEKNVIGGTP